MAGIFVHERYANDKRERMLGWWSHKIETRFDMTNQLDLDRGANGYRISNPPILLVCAVQGFLKVGSPAYMIALPCTIGDRVNKYGRTPAEVPEIDRISRIPC